MRFRSFLPLLLIAAVALPTAALAQESKLVIGGTTYTKWLWGNQRDDGSLYNFTTVPGEGYGDNGQGTELQLLIDAKLSRQVEVKARLHSRFNTRTSGPTTAGSAAAMTRPRDRASASAAPAANSTADAATQRLELSNLSIARYEQLGGANIGAAIVGQMCCCRSCCSRTASSRST